MEKTGIRTYEVSTADFPLEVEIRARGLRECRVVVSDVLVSRAGTLIAQHPVTLEDGDVPLSKVYAIAKPPQRQPCDLLQTVNGFFGKDPADGAKYEIAITSAQGDSFKTSIGVPSIDPGIANLTFQWR